MSMRDVAGFVARALLGHRLRTALSLGGVAIGVVAVALLTGLGDGARAYVRREFLSLGANLLIVLPGRTETSGLGGAGISVAPHDLTLDDLQALGRLPPVRRASALTVGRATIRAGRRTRDVLVIGTTAEYGAIRGIAMTTGRYLPAGDLSRPICVLGPTVARELLGSANPLGRVLRVGEQRCRVVGVTAPRGTSMGMDMDDVVSVPIRWHMRMFDLSSVFRVILEADDPGALAALEPMVEVEVRKRHRGELDVTLLTQDAMLDAFGNIITVLTLLLTGLAAVSLVVAGVGVMNVMLVTVAERTREIGLMKALGASRGQVLRLFLLEAAVLAGAGGACGLLVAYGLAAAFQAIYPSFPITPPMWAAVAVLGLSMLIGLVFGGWPAHRGASLDPVVALNRR